MSERFGEAKRPRRMQSSTQSNPCPDPLTPADALNQLDKDAVAPPVVHERTDASAVPFQSEMGSVRRENGSDTKSSDGTELKSSVEGETAVQLQTQPPGHAGGMDVDAASKPSLPCGPVSGCDSQKDKKVATLPRDGRKYVPSKKAMIDPLKMDMSKPLLTPLTCEYARL